MWFILPFWTQTMHDDNVVGERAECLRPILLTRIPIVDCFIGRVQFVQPKFCSNRLIETIQTFHCLPHHHIDPLIVSWKLVSCIYLRFVHIHVGKTIQLKPISGRTVEQKKNCAAVCYWSPLTEIKWKKKKRNQIKQRHSSVSRTRIASIVSREEKENRKWNVWITSSCCSCRLWMLDASGPMQQQCAVNYCHGLCWTLDSR